HGSEYQPPRRNTPHHRYRNL
ncbi:ubiquinone oxidoreductase, Na(+)-translocating, A subunit, partial [Chlamydia psittaci 06-1683]